VGREAEPLATEERPRGRTAGRVQLVLLLLPVIITAMIAGWQIAEHYL
jgi:hypothetical protein